MTRAVSILLEGPWWLLLGLAAMTSHLDWPAWVLALLLTGVGWRWPLLWAPALLLHLLGGNGTPAFGELLLLLTGSAWFCLAGALADRYRLRSPSTRQRELRLAAAVTLIALWLSALLAHGLLLWRSSVPLPPGSLYILTAGSAAAGLWQGSSSLLALTNRRPLRIRLLWSLLVCQGMILFRGLL